MSMTEKFVTAVKSAGQNGVATKDLEKLLKAKQQTIHTAAYSARQRGHHIANKHGTYLYLGEKSTEIQVSHHKNPTNDGLDFSHYFPDKVLKEMDESSRADFIEQIRRAQLHFGIAKAIVRSHQMAKALREKI